MPENVPEASLDSHNLSSHPHRRKKEITNALVLTEAEIEAARTRRLAAEEAFRKIELEKKKQVSI